MGGYSCPCPIAESEIVDCASFSTLADIDNSIDSSSSELVIATEIRIDLFPGTASKNTIYISRMTPTPH